MKSAGQSPGVAEGRESSEVRSPDVFQLMIGLRPELSDLSSLLVSV